MTICKAYIKFGPENKLNQIGLNFVKCMSILQAKHFNMEALA